MNGLKEVELVSSGYYLPGEPIPFENIDDHLGALENAPEKIKKTIKKLRGVMKGVIKTKFSYFAIDFKTGKPLETNADMATKAIKKALAKYGGEADEIEAIYLGSPVPDTLVPSTTPYIQEKLGIKNCVEIQITSNCTSITKAMECAHNALRVGKYKTVAVVYSQNPSVHLVAQYYNQEKVTIENLLLRWFLSDGAAAVILRAVDKASNSIILTDTFNNSVGINMKAGMWIPFGASDLSLPEIFKEGKHHFGQDYGMVNEKAPIIGVEGFADLLKETNTKALDINHLIITLPSYSIEKTAQNLFLEKLGIPDSVWFSNCENKGYVGGASLISSLDDLISNGMFKRGETTVCYAVESSKWMVGGFCLKSV